MLTITSASGQTTPSSGAIASGTDYTLALKADGTVWAWGRNSNGQLGVMVTVTTNSQRSSPGQVLGQDGIGFLTGIAAIAAGDAHALALKTNGTVWAWGLNTDGRLGDASTTQRTTPVQVRVSSSAFLTDVVAIAAGDDFSLALKSDGSVWAWGSNTSGQLGQGNATVPPTPNVAIQVKADAANPFLGVTAISAGATHALALRADGSVWAWGNNGSGRLGDNTTSNRSFPVQVRTNSISPATYLTNVASISAGDAHSLAHTSSGTAFAWGLNSSGQLGRSAGSTSSSSIAVAVSGLVNATAVEAGDNHSLARLSDGSIRAWGSNSSAQLGLANTTNQTVPVAPSTPVTSAVALAGGSKNSFVLLTDGRLLAYGANNVGQLGDGFTSLRRPTVVQPTDWTDVTAFAAGASHSLAIRSNSSVWAWGLNTNGQLGDNTTTTRRVPVQLSGLSNGKRVAAGSSHTLLLLSDGTLRSWGLNSSGQLGDNTTTSRTAPVALVAPIDVTAIAAGDNHSLALKSDGSVWAWGLNANGQLGDGLTTNRTSPFQLTSITGVTALAAGNSHSLALKLDGTVWAWGLNTNGQLGDASTNQQTTPVQVKGAGGSGFLTGVTAIAAAGTHSLARKSDGTVWAWGNNLNGQLGDNTITQRNFPVQVVGVNTTPTLTGVAAIAAAEFSSYAIRTDGTAIAWGQNSNAQLGDGSLSQRNRPVVVLGLTGASLLVAGDSHALSLRTDQTLRAWGNHGNGQLGYPDRTVSSAAISLKTTSGDADADGLPDAWETTRWSSISVTNGIADPDYDGLSNVQEHLLGTDPSKSDGDLDLITDPVDAYPTDYYNATTPLLAILGGNNQSSPFSQFNSLPFEVAVWNAAGTAPLVNAPVTFTVVTGGGRLAPITAPPLTSVLSRRTDIDGSVEAFYQQPATVGVSSQIRATAGTAQVTFSTTSGVADTLAPSVPTGLAFTSRSAASFTLTWNSSSDTIYAASALVYDVYIGGVLKGTTSAGVTSYAVTGLTPATGYNMTVRARDPSGNASAQSAPLTVTTTSDTTSPSVPAGLASSSIGVTSFTLAWNASTDNVATTAYDVYQAGVLIGTTTASVRTLAVTGLSPATAYAMTVRARDAADNASAQSTAFTVTTLADTAAPSVPEGLASSSVGATSFTLTWNASTDNVATTAYDIYRAGVLIGSTSAAVRTLEVTGLKPSTAYAMTVRARDAVGNASAQSAAFTVTTTVDTTAPLVPTGLVSTDLTFIGFTLAWDAATDNVATTAYDVYRDGVLISSTSASVRTYAVKGLKPATAYSMTVSARDAAGNTSAQSTAITVTTPADTTAPSVPAGLAFSDIAVTSFNLTWDAATDDVATTAYDVYRDGVFVSSTSASVRTYAVRGLKPATTYAMTVSARDASGNASAQSAAITVTTAPDITAPSVPTGLASTGIGVTSFILAWDAATDDVSITAYDVYRGGVLIGAASPSVRTFTVTGLAPSTSYSMTVRARDASGNVSNPSSAFNVTTAVDTIAPSVPTGLASSSLTVTSFTVSWAASTDNVAPTAYDVYRAGVLLGSTTASVRNFAVTGLTPSTAYAITVRARDASGNASDQSSPFTVTTSADTSAPSAPSGLATSVIGVTSFTLTWNISADNVGTTAYDVYRAGVLLGSTSASNRTFTVTGLAPSTAYAMNLRARDAAGNVSGQSSTFTVTTAADTAAPSVPAGLASSMIGATSFTLSWNASTDNVATTAYDVYRAGVLLGSTTAAVRNFAVTGLAPSTTYALTVRARDAVGNPSAQSVALMVTTTVDTTAPSIPADVKVIANLGNRVTLGWVASSDNVGVAGYDVYLNGALVNSIPTATVPRAEVTGLTPATAYTFTVRARDAANNVSTQSAALNLNTESITLPAGLRLWLRSDAGLPASGAVAEWKDQSGLGNHATETNVTRHPQLVANAINGYPVVRFNGAHNLRLPNMLSGASGGEIIAVNRIQDKTLGGYVDTNNRLWSFGFNGTGYYKITGEAFYNNYNAFGTTDVDSTRVRLPAALVQNYHIFSSTIDATGRAIYINGLPRLNASGLTPIFTAIPNLGSNLFVGDFAEILVFDRVLTPGERDQINIYLAAKYAPPGISIPSTPIISAHALGSMAADLSWTTSSNSDQYQFATIQRQVGGGSFTTIASVENKAAYTDNTLEPGKTYGYRVKLTTYAGESAYSATSTITTPINVSLPNLAGLRLWLRSTSGLPTSGAVAEWRDQSGLGNHATETNVTRHPQLVPNAVNGYPVVRFNGAQNLRLPDVLSGASGGEIIAVTRIEDKTQGGYVDTNNRLWSFGASGTGYYKVTGEPSYNSYNTFGTTDANSTRVRLPASLVQNYHIYSTSIDAAGRTTYINGLPRLTAPGLVPAFASAPNLGSNLFVGDFAEVLIFDRVLTDGERTLVKGYLNSRYRIGGPDLPDFNAPAAPTNLAGNNIRQTQLTLSWAPATDDIAVSRYEIRSGGQTLATTTSTSITFSGLLADHVYSYTIRAIDDKGNISTDSLALNLTTLVPTLPGITADSDGDGLPNAWEIANGLNPNSQADANLDSDGDGHSNFAEFLAGSDPHRSTTIDSTNTSALRIIHP